MQQCNNFQRCPGLSHEYQSYLNEIATYLHEIRFYLMEIDIMFWGGTSFEKYSMSFAQKSAILGSPVFIGVSEETAVKKVV